MRIFFLIFLVICYCTKAFSQKKLNDIKFENISVEDGLSHSKVNCIFQDSQGFIWVGTTNGLNRFDGYEFKIFVHDKNDPESIIGNGVNEITEDGKGRLWVGTESGLDMYDRDKETFIHYRNDPKDESTIANNKVYDLCVDNRSSVHTKIWVGTRGGLDCFTVEENKFVHYPAKENSLSHYNVKSIAQDRIGNIWIATFGGGINYLETSTGKITKYLHNPGDENSLSNNLTHSLAIDETGEIFIGTFGNGLDRFDPATGTWTNYSPGKGEKYLNHERVRTVFPDNSKGNFQDCIWIGTWGGGINIFNKKSESFSNLNSDTFLKNGLKSNNISSFLKDNTGVIWVGTSDGIHRYDPKIFKFKNIISKPKEVGGIGIHEIVVLFSDSKDRIWVGTRGGGLNLYQPEMGNFVTYKSIPDDPNSLIDNSVTDIKEDNFGNLWVSTENGFSKFDIKHKTFKNFHSSLKEKYDFQSNNIHRIFIDSKNNIWCLYWYDGIDKLNPETEEITHYPQSSKGDDDKLVRCIYEDDNGNILIGTTSSIGKFSPEKEQFEHFEINQSVSSIWQDHSNEYWLIADEELVQFNFNTLKGIKFPTKGEYNILQSIALDKKGNFWLGSNNGIHYFNVTDHSFKYYNEYDGLQGRGFLWNAATINSNGELYFGGNNGFNIFHPESLIDNPFLPKVVFTEFRLFNKELKPTGNFPLKNSISTTKEIILNYDQNVISFGFSALNYSITEKNQYAYKLENFENRWNEVKNQRTATYTNLDQGEYIFKVKASNNDGIWNKRGAQVKVIVLPPWWETIWFRSTSILLIIGLGILFYKLRTRNLKKQRKILAHKVYVRTKEVQEQKEEILAQKINIEEKNEILVEQKISLIHKQASLEETNDKLITANKKLEELANVIQQANIKLDEDNVVLKKRVEEEAKARIMLKGVDFEDFKKIYPDAQSCYTYLNELKWKKGYQCLKCGNNNYSLGKTPLSRRCSKCGYDESVTTHTIFFRLKFPIVKAFYLVFIICAHQDISIQELSEKLSLRRQTCSAFKQKLLKVMEKKKKHLGDADGWGHLVIDFDLLKS